MFNTERVPVKVYRWDDEGAPKVLPAEGDIKTILKACLVTGYGENENRKEPLGWEMLFENGNDACFRSKHDKSTKWALGVHGNVEYGGCNVVALKNPVSAKKGEIEVALESGRRKFAYANYNGLDRQSQIKWVVVGHERTFLLVILNGGYSTICPHLYFGDFPSLAAADSNNCILSFVGAERYLSNGTNSVYNLIVRDYKGDEAVSANYSFKSMGSHVVNYPNPITMGFCADDIYLSEGESSQIKLRGLLAGLWITMELMPGSDELEFGKIYHNLDGAEGEWMYFRGFNARGFLVNLTAWEI
ncbi:MAG: hypothetical protein E7I68_00820 [Neisseria sp.]|nr:hypothetical protein [Neisseria sp.]